MQKSFVLELKDEIKITIDTYDDYSLLKEKILFLIKKGHDELSTYRFTTDDKYSGEMFHLNKLTVGYIEYEYVMLNGRYNLTIYENKKMVRKAKINSLY